ncbi:hypothetical protein R7Z48_11920 [Vibrio sp. 1567]|uniref:hypothetical protein n=1 Tax=Vibrio sp. 1567 TaxID=3074564 RepID=UPI002963E200|nr:hypothetical protein [Vibrio sp. 1567]MDW2170135.1 hypothetical protein [Vibrio sp. 1567]
MTNTEIARVKKLIWLTPLIGVVIGFAHLGIKHYADWSVGFKEVRTLATVVAGFSFTMMGFLAAIAAFLFSLQKYRFFKRWIQDGYSEIFFTLFKVTFACLFITFGCSLFVFTSQAVGFAFKLMMMSVINNILQLGVVTLVIMDKVAKARESESS